MALALGLALAGGLLLAPPAASAQEVASLRGTFVWDSIASDDVAEAIEGALAGMNFLHRRFARGHLQRENQPYRTVTIEQNGEKVSIAVNGGEPISAPASGEQVHWTRADGERVRVSIVREDGAIRQTFVAENRERENLFRPSADGQGLTMVVTIGMDGRHDPIRYELVYRRGW